jgi:hypothetical protein
MKTPEEWRAMFAKQQEQATRQLLHEIEAGEKQDVDGYETAVRERTEAAGGGE